MTPSPLLLVEDLVVRYGQAQALHGASIVVGVQEIVAVVGANGAGKSTLLRCISGLVRPASGVVRYDGADIGRTPVHRIVERGVSHIPEGRGMLPTLTVGENLRLGARVRGRLDPNLQAKVQAWFPQIFTRLKEAAGMLSGGQQQMLAIARAVLGGPRLILIDELSLGLSPRTTAELMPRLADLRDAGASILLVDQNIHQVLQVADRVYILANGRIVHESVPAKLLADPLLMNRYLGVD